MKTWKWAAIRGELARMKPGRAPRPAEAFWQEFRQRAAAAPATGEVIAFAPPRHVLWHWAAVAACALLVFAATLHFLIPASGGPAHGMLLLEQRALVGYAHTHVRTLAVESGNSGVLVTENSLGAVIWIAGLQLNARNGGMK